MPIPILIATIMRTNGDTGVQTHFRAFAAWLSSKNYSWKIITPFDSPKWLVYPVFALRRIFEPLNGTLSVWWYRHWHAQFLFWALRGALKRGAPCLIYAQCPLSADSALRARVSSAQRVVMVTHFNVSQADEWAGKGDITSGGQLFKAIRQFEFETLPKLDGLVFVSDFMRREVVERIPAVRSVPYRVLPNFLADPGVPLVGSNRSTDLICIGTLESRKNQRYALEIVAAALKLGTSLKLTIVGDGPDRKMLEARAAALGVAANVHFAGFVKNAAVLLKNHKACLHVACIENLPISLIEALSAGIPVFAPAVGGVPEVFTDGIEGRLIPLDNAELAARLIMNWLGSPENLHKAGQAARNRFLAKFEANTVASELASFLEKEIE
jgi:glycosyltransferase involved in cell wall biosynthesis